MRIPPTISYAALGIVALFWCLLVGIPLGVVSARIFASGINGLFDPSVLAIASATAWQASLSTFFSVTIGLALGLWIGAKKGSSLARRLLAIPYGVPTVVVAIVGVAWLGNKGILASFGLKPEWMYSLKAVVLAHVFINAPWAALLVAQARAGVPEDELATARSMGAPIWSRLRFVIFPHLRLTIVTATAQIFALCSMSFALVLLLGGGPPVETLETAIYSRLRYSWLDLNGAAACAFWEMLITLGPWAVVVLLSRRNSLVPEVRRRRVRPSISGFTMASVAALSVVPYLILFRGGFFSHIVDPALLVELKTPFCISLELSALSSLFALLAAVAGVVAVSSFARFAPLLKLALSIPSGVSVLVLGLGVWLAYGRFVDPFDGSFVAMAALQSVVLFPLAFRMLLPVAATSQRELLQAASLLGATPVRAFWYVEWPRWRLPLFSVLALSFGAALGEVAAVSLFYSEKLVPLPLEVTRWMSQYRFEEAQTVATILFVLSAVSITAISFLGEKNEKHG